MAVAVGGVRRVGVALVALCLAITSLMTVVAGADAATVAIAWQAKLGTGGSNGTATAQAYTSGTGSIALKLAKLRASTSLPVTISRGTCGSVGSTRFTIPAVRTTGSGTASRTSSLTAAQVTKLRTAMEQSGRVAIRVGTIRTGGIRCGFFALRYVPIGIVLPSLFKDSGLERFGDALSATGYGSRVLYSRDPVTEKADVEALIRLDSRS